eukprot:m.182609 g.182609  ORF g.182609 m.182609 type:complete len:328 (-) comp24646_c0_seq2:864-1847(-)
MRTAKRRASVRAILSVISVPASVVRLAPLFQDGAAESALPRMGTASDRLMPETLTPCCCTSTSANPATDVSTFRPRVTPPVYSFPTHRSPPSLEPQTPLKHVTGTPRHVNFGSDGITAVQSASVLHVTGGADAGHGRLVLGDVPGWTPCRHQNSSGEQRRELFHRGVRAVRCGDRGEAILSKPKHTNSSIVCPQMLSVVPTVREWLPTGVQENFIPTNRGDVPTCNIHRRSVKVGAGLDTGRRRAPSARYGRRGRGTAPVHSKRDERGPIPSAGHVREIDPVAGDDEPDVEQAVVPEPKGRTVGKVMVERREEEVPRGSGGGGVRRP